ncbi:MAG: lipocalin-like domain-containing protein [Leptolyngbyaceae cyanobacterium RM1_405_57]|nr:lipocalin-like domain-containing protein [Leptolyngbyaceae cyanobacterium RM1_405_57]
MLTSKSQDNPLIGIWKLISVTAIHLDGTVAQDVYGVNPMGYITYTAEGHMMVMFAKGDRPLLSGDPNSPFALESIPSEELAQAFSSFNAYAGTYTINSNTVHHHLTLTSIPNRVGTTLVRAFTVRGDRLTLKTPETRSGGIAKNFELTWERIN